MLTRPFMNGRFDERPITKSGRQRGCGGGTHHLLWFSLLSYSFHHRSIRRSCSVFFSLRCGTVSPFIIRLDLIGDQNAFGKATNHYDLVTTAQQLLSSDPCPSVWNGQDSSRLLCHRKCYYFSTISRSTFGPFFFLSFFSFSEYLTCYSPVRQTVIMVALGC